MSCYNPCSQVWLYYMFHVEQLSYALSALDTDDAVKVIAEEDLVTVWHATDTQHLVHLPSLLPTASRYYPPIAADQPERG